MAKISCSNLKKSYGSVEIVRDFNLEVDDHEFVVFLGPSGCGKSTILRMIAGLEGISGGTVTIGGAVVNDLLPRDRNVAMVFQNYALYPHMSVFDNIAFGLRRMKVSATEIDRRVEEVSAILGLAPYLLRRPTQLSGGQQQRVAIARAMIKTPQVFLFDEPLSNLDAKLRNHMRVEIARLHKRLETTTIYVTHDQLEAMTLGDRIVLLNGGAIEQVGTPAEIYERPRTLFVAGFIGTPNMNLLPVTIADGGDHWRGTFGALSLVFARDQYALENGQMAVLGVRPSSFVEAMPSTTDNLVEGTVDLVEYMGDAALLDIALHSGSDAARQIAVLVEAHRSPKPGATVRLTFDQSDAHLFDARTGLSLLKSPSN
jgi:multiple sugar transport system ATP-binding protein